MMDRVQPADSNASAAPTAGSSALVGPARDGALGRRALLAGAGGSALLLTAGCNPFSQTITTRTVTATAPPPSDPMDGLIATTRLHLLRVRAAVATDKTDAARLTGLQKDRQAHLDALIAEQNRTLPRSTGPGASAPLPTAGAIGLPNDVKLILGVIRTDAADAQQKFIDSIGLVSRYRAALFASIAACLATHRVVLQ